MSFLMPAQMLQQKGLELSAVPFNAAMRYRRATLLRKTSHIRWTTSTDGPLRRRPRNGKLGWEGNLVAIEDRRRMCRKSRSMGEVDRTLRFSTCHRVFFFPSPPPH